MTVRIRSYRTTDAVEVGWLIAETFRRFNLSYAPPDEQGETPRAVPPCRLGRAGSPTADRGADRRGIGRQLMETLERGGRTAGHAKITMQATLYAVPFYRSLGYKKSPGVRSGPCFDGTDFPYQPMKKVL